MNIGQHLPGSMSEGRPTLSIYKPHQSIGKAGVKTNSSSRPPGLLFSQRPDTYVPDQPESHLASFAESEDKMKHHPMTKEQRTILDKDLATIMTTLTDIATLLNACYGDTDPRAARAEELQAAAQRLLWAMTREATASASGNGAGLRRVREMSTSM